MALVFFPVMVSLSLWQPTGQELTGTGISLSGGYWTSVATKTQITSTGSAAAALTELKSAISMLAGARADVGANLARYEAESSTLSVLKDNLSAARSRIADVDVAQESANFARQQILVQSGTAMLAQANVLPQSALRLIG
jgi:flagellin